VGPAKKDSCVAVKGIRDICSSVVVAGVDSVASVSAIADGDSISSVSDTTETDSLGEVGAGSGGGDDNVSGDGGDVSGVGVGNVGSG